MTYNPMDRKEVLRRSGLRGTEEWFARAFDKNAWNTTATGGATVGIGGDGVAFGTSSTAGDKAELQGWENDRGYRGQVFYIHLIYSSDDNSTTLPSNELRLGWQANTLTNGICLDGKNAQYNVAGTTAAAEFPASNTPHHLLIKIDVGAGETTFAHFGDGISDETVTISAATRPTVGTIAYYESNAGSSNYGFIVHYAQLVMDDPAVNEFNLKEV